METNKNSTVTKLALNLIMALSVEEAMHSLSWFCPGTLAAGIYFFHCQ